MPQFNFTFGSVKPPKEKKVKKTSNNNTPKRTFKRKSKWFIVRRMFESVIVEQNGIYGCNVAIDDNEMFVPIHKVSLSCKGYTKLWRKINGMYILFTRGGDYANQNLPNYFFPFKEGSKVLVNLVKEENKHYILIKKVL